MAQPDRLAFKQVLVDAVETLGGAEKLGLNMTLPKDLIEVSRCGGQVAAATNNLWDRSL